MFDQRMFTSFLQQTVLLVINNRDNEQSRQTTCQHDNPPRTTASSTPRSENRPATRQLTQYGFDCPTQPIASRLTNKSHAARLQRHPPAFDACRWSNTTIQAHLRSTLQITRVDSNSHLNARRHFTQRISRDHGTHPDF